MTACPALSHKHVVAGEGRHDPASHQILYTPERDLNICLVMRLIDLEDKNDAIDCNTLKCSMQPARRCVVY